MDTAVSERSVPKTKKNKEDKEEEEHQPTSAQQDTRCSRSCRRRRARQGPAPPAHPWRAPCPPFATTQPYRSKHRHDVRGRPLACGQLTAAGAGRRARGGGARRRGRVQRVVCAAAGGSRSAGWPRGAARRQRAQPGGSKVRQRGGFHLGQKLRPQSLGSKARGMRVRGRRGRACWRAGRPNGVYTARSACGPRLKQPRFLPAPPRPARHCPCSAHWCHVLRQDKLLVRWAGGRAGRRLARGGDRHGAPCMHNTPTAPVKCPAGPARTKRMNLT